ncbi:MAG TPA: flagellar protein [Lachnospiraceae bacterium]|nr:flagellar protein [Lachnospiraceae bacterium]
MNVRNCRKCGRIFNYAVGPHLCPACREVLEADFQRVKEYIREHKGATISQVSEECEVDISQIHQWLRDERLELSDGTGITLQCENCSAPITSGRFCEKCKREVAMGLNKIVHSKQKSEPVSEKRPFRDGEIMRYLNQ